MEAERIIDLGLKRANGILTEVESKTLLASYGIAVNRTEPAGSLDEALRLAGVIGYPLVMKILSTEITHKTEAGGVKVGLRSDDDIRQAYGQILAGAKAYDPDAAVAGVTLQPMIQNPDAEILLGAKRDESFGPVILFGLGGIYAEVLGDRALGLPPLNQTLAQRLMEGTRVFRILKGYRNRPPANLELLEQMLVSLSHLLVDFPQIAELDMNPVIVQSGNPCAVDARVIVKASKVPAPLHLVISPYPEQYECRAVTKDGLEIFVRPIKPEDAPLLIELFNNMSARSRYYRFFAAKQALSPEMLVRLTQVDYDRHIAMVALRSENASEKMVGVARIIRGPAEQQAEFSVAVGDRWQGKGIGRTLVERALAAARDYGIRRVQGNVLSDNKGMLGLGQKLGFEIKWDADAGDFLLTIKLEKQ